MKNIQRNPDVLWREEEDAVAEVHAALEHGDDAGDTGTSVLFSGGTMLSLNYLGTEIWKLCDGRSLEEIAAELAEQFDVEVEIVREDVASFVSELHGKGFVTYE